MSRQERIREFGLEIVLDDEKYWHGLGYRIDYINDKLIKE